jgi:hypothetical protein
MPMAMLLLWSALLQTSDMTVYVFTRTDPSGFTDPLQAQRLQSLEHLKVVLEKKKGITVTPRQDDADLTLEIVDAGKLETGAERTKGLSTGLDGAIFGTRTSKERRPQVQTMMRVGSYQLGFHGTDRTMKRAADAVAEGVEKWVKENRALLEERRRAVSK